MLYNALLKVSALLYLPADAGSGVAPVFLERLQQAKSTFSLVHTICHMRICHSQMS